MNKRSIVDLMEGERGGPRALLSKGLAAVGRRLTRRFGQRPHLLRP